MDRKKLLKGIINIHVHASPFVAARGLDVADTLKEAKTAGYRSFPTRGHYLSSMMGCQVVQRHLGSDSVEVFGSMCLNNVTGLFSLDAVDTACSVGAKMIYFLTVSSKNHTDAHKDRFTDAGKMSVPETPVIYVDKDGRLNPAAMWILEYMSEKDMILGTSRGSAREVDALTRKAVEVSTEKIPVNHPHFHINTTYEQVRQQAILGAYIELNVHVFSEGSKMGPLPTTILEEIFREVPRDRVVLDFDMGQKGSGSPVEALYDFMCLTMERFRITEDELEVMAEESPAILIGLE